MRNSINGAWLLGIIMVFMVFMIAYVSVSINYSRAFRMKSEMVTAIEEYQGINASSQKLLGSLASKYGYKAKGTCDYSTYGNKFIAFDINGSTASKSSVGYGQHNICVFRTTHYTQKADTRTVKYYYRLSVFFNFNLPIFGNIFDFDVSGETAAIYYPVDMYFS